MLLIPQKQIVSENEVIDKNPKTLRNVVLNNFFNTPTILGQKIIEKTFFSLYTLWNSI